MLADAPGGSATPSELLSEALQHIAVLVLLPCAQVGRVIGNLSPCPVAAEVGEASRACSSQLVVGMGLWSAESQ